MGKIILPPSPNWFHQNSTSISTGKHLIAFASFRSILIYKIPIKNNSMDLMQVIQGSGKINAICLFSDDNDEKFKRCVAALTDQGTLSVYNVENCALTSRINAQKLSKMPNSTEKVYYHSLCWALVKGEESVVTVGDGGRLFWWQVKTSATKTFTLDVKKSLTLVENIPHARHEVLVAADKVIVQVSLNDGAVLNTFKGHDYSIYSIRIYPGESRPASFQAENRGKSRLNEDSEEETPCSPIFASTDVGRNLFVWDLSLRRFVAQTLVPPSASDSRKNVREGKIKNQHVALCWTGDALFTSSFTGEILRWSMSLDQKALCHSAVFKSQCGVIYNMESCDSSLVLSGHGRNIQAFDLDSKEKLVDLPTIGSSACCMAFSPHDANRLALGMQVGGIKMLTFGKSSGLEVKSIGMGIRERVMAISWHPEDEALLLYGTSEGQIGILNVFTQSAQKFAFHHQKAVYKVDWAPPVASNKTGLEDTWHAYSFGDRDLVAHSSTSLMQDPVKVNDFIDCGDATNSGYSMSEFSFSPDFTLLAIGYLNGELRILDCESLRCRFVISRIRKVIQHVAWKPRVTRDEAEYTFAVASGEHSAFVFDLRDHLTDGEELEAIESKVITQPKLELSGHSNRCVWISWSPHDDPYLATASYDNTVQIWNSENGEPVGNYGGHGHRVFRCEFSPLDPDSVISFAEENSLHEWRVSRLASKTPAASCAFQKEQKRRENYLLKSNEMNGHRDGEANGTAEVPINAAKKNLSKKSYFPLLHNVYSNKKYFHHLAILALLEYKLSDSSAPGVTPGVRENGEVASEATLNSHDSQRDPAPTLMPHAEAALRKYAHLVPAGSPAPEPDQLCLFLDFFGDLPPLTRLIHREVSAHDANENASRADLLSCWCGDVERRIRSAAAQKMLDPFLVSAAPQVSLSLWEFACEAYSEQLVDEEDIAGAASYLVLIRKNVEAVNLLLKHKYYREALVIAKYKCGSDPNVLESVLSAWSVTCIYEGNVELSAVLYLTLGDIVGAARSLSRRTETKTLLVSAHLYLAAKNEEMARLTAILAFQEAMVKNDFSMFEPLIGLIPDLLWCKSIFLCHEYFRESIKNLKSTLTCGSLKGYSEGSHTDEPDSFTGNNFALALKSCFEKNGITPDSYGSFFKDIKSNLSVPKLPQSLKHLWYLIAVNSTLLIFDSYLAEAEHPFSDHVQSVLEVLSLWQKTDQIFYFTHVFSPNGFDDIGFDIRDDVDKSTLRQLQQLYVSSELKMIISELESNDHYVPWLSCSDDGDENHIVDNDVNNTGSETADEPVQDSSHDERVVNGNLDGSKELVALKFYHSFESFVEKFKVYFSNCEQDTEIMSFLKQILSLLKNRDNVPDNLITLF